jgi:hypothetical protein
MGNAKEPLSRSLRAACWVWRSVNPVGASFTTRRMRNHDSARLWRSVNVQVKFTDWRSIPMHSMRGERARHRRVGKGAGTALLHDEASRAPCPRRHDSRLRKNAWARRSTGSPLWTRAASAHSPSKTGVRRPYGSPYKLTLRVWQNETSGPTTDANPCSRPCQHIFVTWFLPSPAATIPEFEAMPASCRACKVCQ